MPWYRNRIGEQVWYEERGAGHPLILLHGWCMSSAVWKYQFDGLSDSVRLLAPDFRGHGRSRDVAGKITFSGLATDLVDLIEARDLEKVVLVGWSMGAQIALQACAELSGRLAGMVLISATPRFTASDDFPCGLADSEARGMRLKVQRNTGRALEGFYSRLFAAGELEGCANAAEIVHLLSSIESPDTEAALASLDALVASDMRHLLPSITTPTLIMNGGQDRICLPPASRYLHEHIAGSEQVLFPECGHAPFWTFRDDFNANLVRFSRSCL
jgi:pimeloyl-[acyl-carrier protein] methyl ester esterase